MSLIKTSLLNGVAVVVRVASGLVLNKILAVYVGPAGYAIIGQFQNAVSILISLAGGLVAPGVTQITAQNFDDEAKKHRVWRAAIRFSIITSLLAGFLLLLVGTQLSEWLLNRADMSSIFVWLAISLPAMAANNLLLAIVNGEKEVGIYVIANIIGSVTSMLTAAMLAYNYGLYGALLAFTINPAIVLLTTAGLVYRRAWFSFPNLWGKIDKSSVRELSGFALMGITSAIVTPVSYMLIRDDLISHLGLNIAGYWQASWKISETYLMLVTSTLTIYYLPRLSEIRTKSELNSEVIKVYKFVMPLVIVGAILIYFLRDFIVATMFTKEFYPMRTLFPWQLVGDVIKIGAWILGYILVGRAMVRHYVISEILFAVLFVLISWRLVDACGVIGVPIAYAISYTFYWLVMAYLTKLEMRKMESRHHA